MRKQIPAVILIVLAAALLSPAPATADNQFYLNIQSREILYDPAAMTAASFVKNIVSGKNFRLFSDRLQVDFNSNTLRAAGNVYLYTARTSEYQYPQFGEPEAVYEWEFFAGREMIVNFEFREAAIYPREGSEKPIFLDMNFARVPPELKSAAAPPAFSEMPDDGVFACMALGYSSTGRFSLSDATYFAEGGRQSYTALLVADGPDLKKYSASSNRLSAKNSYMDGGNPDPERVFEAGSGATLWLLNRPGASTILDVDGVLSEKQGFKFFSPSLVQTVSLGNFAASGRAGLDETSAGAAASISTFTPSGNNFSLTVNHDTHDFTGELDRSHSRGSRRNVFFNSTFWEDSFRVSATHYDSRFADDFHYLGAGPWSDYDNRYRETALALAFDPFPLPARGLHADLYASLSRDSSNSRNISAADTFDDNYNRTLRLSLNPRVISGPFRVVGGFHLAQTLSFLFRSTDTRRGRTETLAGAVSAVSNSRRNENYYDFDAASRLFAPLGNSLTFEVSHDYERRYGAETAALKPGLSYTWNMRDYVFAGCAYDFDSRDWETFGADFVARRSGAARFFYSYRFNLPAGEVEKNAAGLIFDFGENTLAVSYEDRDSDFRIAVFTGAAKHPAGGRLTDSMQ